MSPANPGVPWAGQWATTTTTNGPVYIGGGGTSFSTGLQGITTFGPIVAPYAGQPVNIGPLDAISAWNRLNPAQLARVLREHDFIEMEGSSWCLLCYGLDQMRTQAEHRFTIREE